MSKFHITASGEPAKCSATTRACPLGGEHYDSLREAMEAMTDAEVEDTSTCKGCGDDEVLEENGLCEDCNCRVMAWDSMGDPVFDVDWDHELDETLFAQGGTKDIIQLYAETNGDDWAGMVLDAIDHYGGDLDAGYARFVSDANSWAVGEGLPEVARFFLRKEADILTTELLTDLMLEALKADIAERKGSGSDPLDTDAGFYEEMAADIVRAHRDSITASPTSPNILERELEIATRRGQLVDRGLEEEVANELLALPLADQFTVDDLHALHQWDASEGWVLEEFAAYEAITREEGNATPTPHAVIRRMGEGWQKNMDEPNAEPDAHTTRIYADLCHHFGASDVSEALSSKLAVLEESSG